MKIFSIDVFWFSALNNVLSTIWKTANSCNPFKAISFTVF